MDLLRSPGGEQFDRTLFDDAINRVADAQPPPEILGSVLAIAVLAKLRDSQDVCSALAGSFSGTAIKEQDRVGVLRGLLFTTPEIIWRRSEVLAAIDTLLCDMLEEEFLELIPHIRLAFTALNPSETDRLAESLARMHGGRGTEFVQQRTDFNEADLQKGIALQRQLKEALRVDGLEAWLDFHHE